MRDLRCDSIWKRITFSPLLFSNPPSNTYWILNTQAIYLIVLLMRWSFSTSSYNWWKSVLHFTFAGSQLVICREGTGQTLWCADPPFLHSNIATRCSRVILALIDIHLILFWLWNILKSCTKFMYWRSSLTVPVRYAAGAIDCARSDGPHHSTDTLYRAHTRAVQSSCTELVTT